MQVSSQRIWLVCVHHPQKEDAIPLGKRLVNGFYRCPESKALEDWFDVHKHCGGGHDHFTVSYDHAKDYDVGSAVSETIGTILRDSNGSH